MKIIHLVTTSNFAGTERYASNVANEIAARGLAATVIGGDRERMKASLRGEVRWLEGATVPEAVRSLIRLGQQDVIHAHLTLAEAIALATRRVHRAPVVSTRHIAAHRGKTRAGQLVAPWISAGLARQIAVSEYVAARVEHAPDAVIPSGVPVSPNLLNGSNRVVLVAQRLEPEKDTVIAIKAFARARMSDEGWTLRIVGDGSERALLERFVREERIGAVTFGGWASDIGHELALSGIFLATSPVDSFGLGVLEAMAAGIPVAACASGGHLETVGVLPGARLFDVGDAAGAAAALRSFLPEVDRAETSARERELVADRFTITRHVDDLLSEYAVALGPGHASGGRSVLLGSDTSDREGER